MNIVLLVIQAIITFTLGAVMGSFLLVVASRMNVRTMYGRSKCDQCGTQLQARDMVPVVSYLVLAGRCRSCQSRISPRVLWTEICMGLGFLVHSFVAGDAVALVVGYIVLSLCCVMALYDAKTQFLPNTYLYSLVGVGVIYRFLAVYQVGIAHSPIGYLYMAIPALLLAAIVLVSRGRWMGAGDPVLLLGLSIVVGTWQGALFTLLFASWIGLIYVAIIGVLNWHRKKPFILNNPIAFGPCLIAGFLIAWWLSLAGLLVFV